MPDFFVLRMGESSPIGPFSGSKLKGLVERGEISPEDQIKGSSSQRWRPAREVKGLFDLPSVSEQAVAGRETPAETRNCPLCAETVAVAAKKCKHCGEFFEPLVRETGVEGPKFLVPPHFGANLGVAAVLSLVLPGSGQIYRGRIGRGFAWMLVVPCSYFIGVRTLWFAPLALIPHILCVCSAATTQYPKAENENAHQSTV